MSTTADAADDTIAIEPLPSDEAATEPEPDPRGRHGKQANPLVAAWRHPTFGPVLKVVVGYVVVMEVLVQAVFGRIDVPFVDVGFLEVGRKADTVPREVMLNGAIVGMLYAMLAMGIILIYKANRLINFAAAALGSVPAVLMLTLISLKDFPYLVALPLALIGGGLLGGLVDVTLMRRFRTSPRLIATVATIGVSQILALIEFYIPNWVSGGETVLPPQDFPTPFNGFAFDLGIRRFDGDHLFTIGVVVAITLGLGAFFKFTDVGIAVRASAENGDRASLLGIPVRRVATVVWILAGTLSAVAIFLRAPLVGLPLGGLIGPAVLLYGLSVAVIARMDSLPTALVAGMGIGMIDQAAVYSARRASLSYSVMLLVIIVALLAQRKALSRAYDMAANTWQSVKEYRPIPHELRQTPEVLLARAGLALVLLGLFVVAPLFASEGQLDRMQVVLIYAMLGVSMVILTGWAGQISLGQFAFAGVGAAVTGGLAANYNLDFFLCLLAGGLAGAFAAVLIGIPALRIQGLFLAVTTLAFAFTVQNFVLEREFFGWLLPEDFAFVERPLLYGTFDIDSNTRFYYVSLFFLALTMLAARSLRRFRGGRILIGVRDNGRTMQAFGVNLARTRLAAFAISGFFAALAGGLLAYQQRQVEPGVFSPIESIDVFVMTVIGGLTSVGGALIGAVYLIGIPYLFSTIEAADLAATGVGVLILLLFLPGGLAEGFYLLRDKFLRWVAARNGIHVPSLVADSLVADTAATDHALSDAEHRVEEVISEDGAIDFSHVASSNGDGSLIRCPECEAQIPVDEVRFHKHFQVREGTPS